MAFREVDVVEIRKARRTWLRLSAHAPHRDLLLDGLGRLHYLPQST